MKYTILVKAIVPSCMGEMKVLKRIDDKYNLVEFEIEQRIDSHFSEMTTIGEARNTFDYLKKREDNNDNECHYIYMSLLADRKKIDFWRRL